MRNISSIIGYRTIKTAIGVTLSILIAQFLGLEFYTASGILTLLCIQKSRKQSKRAALSRLFSCLLVLFYSSALFTVLGYHAFTFLVLLLTFIPLVVRLRIQEGIASSSVIVMHVYMHHKVELSFFINEILVIAIGLGVALLINWYMPSIDKKVDALKAEVDRLIAAILKEYGDYLQEGYTLWDGKELLALSDKLASAKQMALLDEENRGQSQYTIYFDNKRRQYELLERMLPEISQITSQLDQSKRIGAFLMELSKGYTDPSKSDDFYEQLRNIRELHRHLPLPEDRNEFENRAHLFTVANDLERFLNTM
jgi:uncharacterized membrane protein YgaE (UPF0421/DUF939 family)